MTENTFFGETYDYWLALKERADTLCVNAILRELVAAEAKVHYYENHIKQMNTFKEAAEK